MKTNIQKNNNKLKEKIRVRIIRLEQGIDKLMDEYAELADDEKNNDNELKEKFRVRLISFKQGVDKLMDEYRKEYGEWPDDKKNNE